MLWPDTSATTHLLQANDLSGRQGRCTIRTSSDWLRRWLSCVFLTAPPATASYVTRGGWSSTIALSMPAKASTTKWQLGKIFGKVDEVRWFKTGGRCGVCTRWGNVLCGSSTSKNLPKIWLSTLSGDPGASKHPATPTRFETSYMENHLAFHFPSSPCIIMTLLYVRPTLPCISTPRTMISTTSTAISCISTPKATLTVTKT